MQRVRVGLIGCGGFQRHRIARVLSEIPELEIVGLADPSEQQLDETAHKYPALAATPRFADHPSLLRETKPDAVMIATPHTQHVHQILDSFDAGCHVLCEKPLVTSVADARTVMEKRDAVGKVGMVSYQRHFQAEFRLIRDKIASGDMGDVQFVQALNCQEWKRFTKGTWRQDPVLSGGGQLNDTGSHLVDVLLWATGLTVDTVSARCDNRGTPVDINSSLTIRFDNGALGSLSIMGDAPHWHEDVTICCDNGAFLLRNGKLTISDGHGNQFTCEHLTGGSSPDRNFVDAIQGRAENESPFECGLRVAELTEAAWSSSARGGEPVQVSR